MSNDTDPALFLLTNQINLSGDLWIIILSMLKSIIQNPYRILGVLSNSTLQDRDCNQNRLTVFAKIGTEVSFSTDFIEVLHDKPLRSIENVATANTALNLGKDRLKHALFWFINISPIDEIALKHLQAGNIDKAIELFETIETFSSLLNTGILQFIKGDYSSGFSNVSMVIRNSAYRSELLAALDLQNLTMTENEIASMFIEAILKEIPATTLLSAATYTSDKAIIRKIALDEPISVINSAITTTKFIDTKNAPICLYAGSELRYSTTKPLKQVKDITGVTSPQYQVVANNLAEQISQCGINYYNNAPYEDLKCLRKAMALQEYALKIAIGKLTKDRCRSNYDILKKAVDNMPQAEETIETCKVKDEPSKEEILTDNLSTKDSSSNNEHRILLFIAIAVTIIILISLLGFSV